MILKPQDVVVLLKLVALGDRAWTFQGLAVELSISQSEVHAAVRRAVAARLMTEAASGARRPRARAQPRAAGAREAPRRHGAPSNALPGLVIDGSPAVRTPVVRERLRAIAALGAGIAG